MKKTKVRVDSCIWKRILSPDQRSFLLNPKSVAEIPDETGEDERNVDEFSPELLVFVQFLKQFGSPVAIGNYNNKKKF